MKNALRLLLLAVALLAGVLLFIRFRELSENAPRKAFVESGLSPDSVARLKVDYFGESVTLERKRGAGWGWVTSGDGFPADTLRMRRVLGYLLNLQSRETVAHNDSGHESRLNLTEFGLDSASARHVEWTLFDGRTYRVLLGKVSGIDFGSSFWKPADSAVAYRTPGTFVFEVSSRPRDWKDTALFAPFASRDIRAVEVTWRDDRDEVHTFALERGEDDTSFALRAGGHLTPSAQVKQSAAAKIFTHAAQFKVDEFVAGVGGVDTVATAERRRVLAERPVMVVRILLKNGRTNQVIAGPAIEGMYRYVKHPWHPDPVRVFGWRFEYFRKTGEEFRERESRR
jgi:Domain of unknown function (DUF4340)